jgi:DNA-directed RNA polymerase sigma subunit (sigma70/sigma32)
VENAERTAQMRLHIARIAEQRTAGRSYSEIVGAEPRPRVVELLTESAGALDAAGADVRRTEARILYEEGMTMDRIAELFGVTRQRISVLLRDQRERPA